MSLRMRQSRSRGTAYRHFMHVGNVARWRVPGEFKIRVSVIPMIDLTAGIDVGDAGVNLRSHNILRWGNV
jgi:hypothetical protein